MHLLTPYKDKKREQAARPHWLRCVLSHTLAVLLCQQRGVSPLQFDHLLTD